MRRADNLITFMCRLSSNLGASTSWNPQGLFRPVIGLLYFYLLHHIPQDSIFDIRPIRCHTVVYAHSRESSPAAGTGHVLRWHTWWNHKVGETMRYVNCINSKVWLISCRPTHESWFDVQLIEISTCQNYSCFTFRCEMVHCPFKDKRTFVVCFWVIPRRLKFICGRFGTLCLFHLHRQVGKKEFFF